MRKNLCTQKNRIVPDAQRKRSQWIETISGANAEHQIYLDESGINTNLTRHYAHAVHGKRAMDATPINTPAGTTVLSSIRLNGSLVYTTYQGGTTAQRFREYMGKQLIPSLEKDDVVIMDNMRSHHTKIVTELLDKAGISYLYLPPYSPDLNPIEKMWSKMKSFLRKRKVRVAAELPDAVKAALETISTNDCKGGHASGICVN
ncbi:IS630 family transposase [Fusicatenibacter saccharivorans]|uniref:IS630 family transposase n=1 Tax=Fusicatenibacter saccharivorans TaxID=1150298 RepID=UPI003F8A1C11